MLKWEIALFGWHNSQFRIPYSQIRISNSHLVSTNGFIPEAPHKMIVDHSHRLHVCVTDECPDEFEPPGFQILAHGIRFRGSARDLLDRSPVIYNGLAINKLPHVLVEASEFFLNLDESLCVVHGAFNLQAVPHNPCVLQQLRDLGFIILRDLADVEIVKSLPVCIPFPQNRNPAQSGLCAFENQLLKEMAVVVHRHAPFFIMILLIERIISGPGTADERHGYAFFATDVFNRRVYMV
jgi:hypothetical protein